MLIVDHDFLNYDFNKAFGIVSNLRKNIVLGSAAIYIYVTYIKS